MRRIGIITISTIFAFAILVLALELAEDDTSATAAEVSGRKITILFTGDDYGNVKSCGCDYTGDLGGIHRRAAFVQKSRQSDKNIILVDTGDMLPGSGGLLRIKADVYTKALPSIGYDAVGLGDNEVLYMRQNRNWKLTEVPALCSNITDSKSSLPLASRKYIIKTTGSGLKVGIMSVLGDIIINPEMQKKLGIKVIPPTNALPPIIDELKNKVDILVLISHTGFDTAKRLAEILPEVDVIIAGHPPVSSLDKAARVNNSVIVQSWPGGKRVGRLTMEIGSSDKIDNFKCDYIGMSTDIPEDPVISQLIAKHDKEIEEYYAGKWKLDQSGSDALDNNTSKYMSSSSCKDCHETEYNAWKNTSHATAYESLKNDGRFDNIECISCHTTGARTANGFRSNDSTPELSGVQCESCHGVGESHVSAPGKGYGTISETTCIQCHDPAHSAEFNFMKHIKRVVHRKP